MNYGPAGLSGGISYHGMRDGLQNGSTLGGIRAPSYALPYASAVDFGVAPPGGGAPGRCQPPPNPRSHAGEWARESFEASGWMGISCCWVCAGEKGRFSFEVFLNGCLFSNIKLVVDVRVAIGFGRFPGAQVSLELAHFSDRGRHFCGR